MPNTSSAKKALRRDNRRKGTNLERKKKMKSTIKKYNKMIDSGNKEEAKSFLPSVYKVLDKMAKVSFIKKNKARRLKSKLSKKVK
ncbi:MAG: 30S ribosomal protein S20 [Candidatus Paceibacterota bacterium]